MTRPASSAAPVTEMNGESLSSDWRGLVFASPATEAEYQLWRTALVVPGTRVAIVATLIMWVVGTVTSYLTAPDALLRALPVALATVLPVCLATLAATFVEGLHRWILTLSALTNVTVGLVASWIFHEVFRIPAGASISAIMVTLFAFTIFRLPPLSAVIAASSSVVPVVCVLVGDYWENRLSAIELWAYTFTPLITLTTGWLVCVVLERSTRIAFRNEHIIARQQRALMEERAQLSRFLAPEVAQMIRERGIEATLTQQTLELTAVCCDLRGFTAFTQRHGAQQMGVVLREYYELIVETARSYGGTVKDFAGDGGLILIGAPVPRPDHVDAGLSFARELSARVGGLTARVASAETPLGIGVGIATGACAVGAIGSQSRLEYTAVGSAVNLAARLCASAADGELRICPQTARVTRRLPSWRSERECIKGFADPIDVIVETIAARDRPPWESGARSPVG